MPTTSRRDMNYSHTSFSHTLHPGATTNSAENCKHHRLCLSLPFRKPVTRFQLPMPNLHNEPSLCGVCRLEGKREGETLQRVAALPHPSTRSKTHTHTLPHSSLSAPLLAHTVGDPYAHTHTHTGRRELSLCFSPKCRLRRGCCRSELSSESKVRGEHHPPILPASVSPAGDTHLLYGILLSLPLLVTMVSAIKRFSSDCQDLTRPPATPPAAAHDKEQPLLIFISHMFGVQRKEIKIP